jgi:hypothetical protein
MGAKRTKASRAPGLQSSSTKQGSGRISTPYGADANRLAIGVQDQFLVRGHHRQHLAKDRQGVALLREHFALLRANGRQLVSVRENCLRQFQERVFAMRVLQFIEQLGHLVGDVGRFQ